LLKDKAKKKRGRRENARELSRSWEIVP
jgi:hypothetical protein